jgi:hypothetical protein
MAEKRPLCQYSGTIEELRVGDTVPGSSGGSFLTPESSATSITITAGYQLIVYQSFEVVNDLVIEGTLVLI